MKLQSIPIESFRIKPMHLWDIQSLLLTSGDFGTGHYNAMTVGWGSFGYLWSRPFVQVVVRPTRYTFEFMEHYDTFSVCAFPQKYHKVMTLLGTKSGRDGDKIAEAGITPVASNSIAAPGYTEAELILECRKVYWDDFHPEHFIDPGIDANYPHKDYHRIYYGEIQAIHGEKKYATV